MMFFLGAHRVPYAFRFNLLQSYLEACGLDATEASVRALMLDAEVATLTSLPGMLGTGKRTLTRQGSAQCSASLACSCYPHLARAQNITPCGS